MDEAISNESSEDLDKTLLMRSHRRSQGSIEFQTYWYTIEQSEENGLENSAVFIKNQDRLSYKIF
jgi:hypothetical protein